MITRKSGEANSVLKRCIFNGCNSDSRYSTISFISFPKPCLRVRNNLLKPIRRHIESCPSCHKCQRWVDLCFVLGGINGIEKNAYICSSHFVDRNPSTAFPEPLPVAEVMKIRFQRSKTNNIDGQEHRHQAISEKHPGVQVLTKKIHGEEDHNEKISKKRPHTITGAKRSKTKKIDGEEHCQKAISEKHPSVTIRGAEISSEKENDPNTTRTAVEQVSQDDPHPTNIYLDPVDLNEFFVSTNKNLQQMCDELQISTILNKNLSYVSASKERITLTTPVEGGGQSLEILIVNKEPTDTSPALLETATELENMVKQMENMLSASNVIDGLDYKDAATQTNNPISETTNQQISRLRNDNVILKNQVASLETKVSELQRQLQMEREGKNYINI